MCMQTDSYINSYIYVSDKLNDQIVKTFLLLYINFANNRNFTHNEDIN